MSNREDFKCRICNQLAVLHGRVEYEDGRIIEGDYCQLCCEYTMRAHTKVDTKATKCGVKVYSRASDGVKIAEFSDLDFIRNASGIDDIGVPKRLILSDRAEVRE